MVLGAFQDWQFNGFPHTRLVNSVLDFVVVLVVGRGAVDCFLEALLVDGVGRSVIFGVGVEARGASGEDGGPAIGVVKALLAELSIDGLEDVVGSPL